MKFTIVFALSSALAAMASPTLNAREPALDADPILAARALGKRTSCQTCDIWVLNAGDACCSAHCIADGDEHGGHCNANADCICN